MPYHAGPHVETPHFARRSEGKAQIRTSLGVFYGIDSLGLGYSCCLLSGPRLILGRGNMGSVCFLDKEKVQRMGSRL